jgi:multidrug efflux system outer membrane protein
MRSRVIVRRSFALLLLGMAACSVGPNYRRPGVSRPGQYKAPLPDNSEGKVAPEWWRLYRDTTLDDLMGRALQSNQTLKQAVARVDEARALAKVAASAYYPTLALQPTAGIQRFSANRPSTITGLPAGQGVTVGDFVLPLDLTYELDVWGRVRRSVQAAKAQEIATIDDAAVIRLSVQTDVAQYYYTLRLLDAQLEILGRTLTSYEEQVRLLSVQVRTGIASAIALNQAQAQLHSTRAQQADVTRSRANEEHALAILCGRPASLFSLPNNPLRDSSPPAVPPGLPASVLTRRPDVAEAEQNVVAANAQVGVATAEMYPHFNLTGSAGFESSAIAALFDWQSRLGSLVAGITAPIFEGGRLTANRDAAKARYRQAVAMFVNTVLVAYGDVEDALTDLHALTMQVGDLNEAVRASEDYRRLADVQYRNGLVDYLVVIDAERTLLTNELALAQATNMQMSASIHLIKALGGGWVGPERG